MGKLLLGGVIGLAFLLRIWSLPSYPAGFNADEASFGYDAYSLLKTGKDQWGQTLPLALQSFGDFKLPLYSYLTIPSVAVFGLSEFSVRLPNVILGTLSVLVTYLMVGLMFKKYTIQLFSAFLLAVSPWHISLSRGAFEANLTTFLLPFGVWAFLKGLTVHRWLWGAGVIFGINLFSYHSARLVTPLLVTILIFMNRWEIVGRNTPVHITISRYKWPILIFLAFLLLAVYSVFSGAGTRGADIAVFNPTDNWIAVSDRRYEAVLQGFPDGLSRLFSNKPIYTVNQFFTNYLAYFSPQFLFTQGVGEATYGLIPGQGMLYLAELPFIILAILFFIKNPSKNLGFILLWIVLAPMPAGLTKGIGLTGSRTAIMMPAIQILSAYGGIILFQKIAQRWKNLLSKRILLSCYFVILLSSLTLFLESYIYHAPRVNAPSMSYGWQEAFKYLNTVDSGYKEIIISRSFSEPQIFIGFYKMWDPSDYQTQSRDWLRYKREKLLFIDQLGEYHLGKYTIREIHYSEDQDLASVLLVGRPRDFPKDTTTLKTIYYPDGKQAILIVEPQI